MFVNKAGVLLAVLLTLSGCGQEGNADATLPDDAQNAVSEIRQEIRQEDAASVAAASATDAASGTSNAEIALAGRADYMQGLRAGCINSEYPELEQAKRPSFCDCVQTAIYARMSDAEWVEWDAIMVEKGKIWGARFEQVFAIVLEKQPEPAVNPELAERIERFDADWQQRYAQTENACMKQLGVTVKLTH